MLELITQSIQTKKRTKMKKYLLFIALACVLGNRALAQNSTETIDFSGWNYNSSDGSPYATLTWSGNSISSITATDGGLTRTYTNRFTVDNINNWRLWGGHENNTYLQLNVGNGVSEGTVYIHNLNEGDHVTVVKRGHCTIMSSNTQSYGNNNTAGTQYNGEELTITASGTLELKFYNDWESYPGIRSITIQEGQGQGQQDPTPNGPRFNYDPGYEVYDFFEVRDRILERNSNGDITVNEDNTIHTDYSVSDADFELNGDNAQYFTYNNNNLTLNNRIAIDQSGRWRFTRGLIVPEDATDAYFSISNLKKGDRVQIFYTGDDPVFASQADGTYNGCSAFYDTWNDGDFNANDGDHYITPGTSPADKVEYIASLDRNEGTIARDENVRPTTLHSSAVYVITEDGHMDFRLKNTNPLTRIVKVYIWSDHQATMIDDSSEREYQYTSHFDITGELQAKEHIVPGGLEVRIGNEDKTQHAIVVASKEGPVSYVNAVDGFKLPGITKNNDQIQINFNLGGNNNSDIPTTGTFYKFIPEVDGTMKVKFTAYSMYYYRYDINGNAIYYDNGRNNDGDSPWLEEFGRANEQTVNRLCPYYIKVSSDNGATFSDAQNVTWGSVSSGSGGGNGNVRTLFTNPTSSDVLLIDDIVNLGGTDTDNITFYFENVTDNSIGGLVDSNWGNNNNYNFNPNGQTGTMQFTLTLSQIRNIANGTGGVRANVWNSTLTRVTLTTSGSSTSTISWLGNGGDGEFVLEVEAGKIYYLYGGWTTGANGNNTNYNNFSGSFIRDINDNKITPHACGVAELFDVAFTPAKQIYPLAKWVPSGTEADDNLAFIVGYQESELTVKKMSGNITGCHPYIYETTDNDGNTIHKLGIKDVTFKDGENPGGVVLIKFGTTLSGTTTYYKADPVYVFTVAYDADYHSTSNYSNDQRGHTWDFTASSLNGLEWDPSTGVPTRNTDGGFDNIPSQNYAQAEPFGTYFNNYFGGGENSGVNTGSFLYEEMNYVDNGVNRSDWMFNYRLQKNGVNYDPRFLNKYDMEGDNADMIWDTEGIIILANSNMSCIFNEFGNGDIHSSEKDPDRYVGILSGGSFLIPHLNKDDRVIIWMGSGVDTDEMELEDMKFHITNARDALYKEILEDDVYVAGGSHWDGSKGDPNYRGCYHFYAKADGDMVFTLEGSNSVCKLYKIQIYSGKRIKTNDLVPVGDSPLYLVSKKELEEETEGTYSIQYLGKGESVGEPEMAGKTGNLADAEYELAALDDDETTVHFTTTVNNKFGVFNMRLNDLERNNTYVADFADRNFPIGYYEELPQPYTWDFTDVNRFNTTYLASENTKYSEDDLNIWDAEKNFTWKRDDTDDLLFAPGGQIYADAQMIAESAGMRFTPMNVGSGTIQATAEGLIIKTGIDDDYSEDATERPVTGGSYGNNTPEKQSIWEIPWGAADENHPAPINYDSSIDEDPRIGWKLTIPNLPNLTTAYIRVQTIKDLKPKLTLDFIRTSEENGHTGENIHAEWSFFKKVIDNGDGTKDIIVGVSPTDAGQNEPFGFVLNNVIVKKIATSKDIKPAFGPTGYQTESRHREIDHRLTGFFTGEDIEAFYGTLGTNDKGEKVVKLHSLKILDKADPNYSGDGIGGEGDVNWRNCPDKEGMGCILYHRNGKEVTDSKGNKQIDRSFSILDGGFHLFVPDMHDMDNTTDEDGYDLGGPDDITSENILWARYYNADVWSWGTRVARTVPGLTEKSGDDINYILSATHYSLKDENDKGNGYDVGFYHVHPTGAEMPVHSCYMRMSSGDASLSKIFFDFADDSFEEIHGITTQIDDASHLIDNGQLTTGHADWYNLNGQKLSGKPSANGLYIKNGKKVIIK